MDRVRSYNSTLYSAAAHSVVVVTVKRIEINLSPNRSFWVYRTYSWRGVIKLGRDFQTHIDEYPPINTYVYQRPSPPRKITSEDPPGFDVRPGFLFGDPYETSRYLDVKQFGLCAFIYLFVLFIYFFRPETYYYLWSARLAVSVMDGSHNSPCVSTDFLLRKKQK